MKLFDIATKLDVAAQEEQSTVRQRQIEILRKLQAENPNWKIM